MARSGSLSCSTCRPSTIFSVPTFILPISGRNFATGSLTCSLPSSTICMTATLTIGLVME